MPGNSVHSTGHV